MYGAMRHLIVLAVLFLAAIPVVHGECLPTDEVCEFQLEVEFAQTMIDTDRVLVKAHNSSLYTYDVIDIETAEAVPVNDVITADGYHTPNLVVAINGQMPGPAIIVYQGQTVRVHVTNNVIGHVISMHWHGITQRNTPWMDGASYITQCPILYGQTFMYEFTADTAGTYLYHDHAGLLRMSGLYGPFIVKYQSTEPDIVEHIVIISEYNHDWSPEMQQKKSSGRDHSTGTDYEPFAINGAELLRVFFHAGLINGRGRYYNKEGMPNEAPLTEFEVTAGRMHKFRVINAGHAFPFRFSVDNHTMLLVSADGHRIEPLPVESCIINNGERFDFILNANQTPGNYFFRAEVLDTTPYHRAEAIIRYSGVEQALPTSQRRQCTADNICVIANCFFPEYPGEEYSRCLDMSEFNDYSTNAVGHDAPDSDIKEIFLNFGGPPSVNRLRFVSPTVNAMAQPNEVDTLCESDVCMERFCRCTSSITINRNDIVQLVILLTGDEADLHPIHVHGHAFQVMKVGHYTPNVTTGQYESPNTDIACNNDFCNIPRWSNDSWRGNSIPGLKLEKPVFKDTVTIGTGMYIIVRFKADNPGLWLLHCHMDFHMFAGMTTILNESFADIPEAPVGFPECRPYPSPGYSPTQTPQVTTPIASNCGNGSQTDTLTVASDGIEREKFWTAVGILGGIALLEFCVIVVVCVRNKGGNDAYRVEK